MCVIKADAGITNTSFMFLIFHTDVEYAIECHTQADNLGVSQVPVAFQFKLEDSSQPFFIIRTIVSISSSGTFVSLGISDWIPSWQGRCLLLGRNCLDYLVKTVN